MKKTILTLILSSLLFSCLNLPRKKLPFDLNQNELFQECRLMKVINECYILIKVKEDFYVSKVAGFSFDTQKCHPSWTPEQVRTLKINWLYDMINRRSRNLTFYCLDVSKSKDYSEILMVQFDLCGYGNLNKIILDRGSATFEETYIGPYHNILKDISKQASIEIQGPYGPEGPYGLFNAFDLERYNRDVSIKFNLTNYPMIIPPVVGKWIPNKEQKELLHDKFYERTSIKLN